MRCTAIVFASIAGPDDLIAGLWSSLSPNELPFRIDSHFLFVMEADEREEGRPFDYRIAVTSGAGVVDLIGGTPITPIREHPEVPVMITLQHQLVFDVTEYGRYVVCLYVNDELVGSRPFGVLNPTENR